MPWFADQSRYMAGFSCPWQRLIRYHLNWIPYTTAPELVVGSWIHSLLEKVMRLAQQGKSQSEIKQWLIDAQQSDPAAQHDGEFPDKARDATLFGPSNTPTPLGEAEGYGLAHAWVRCNLPWLLENYEILGVEEEYTLDLGNDMYWMARPDVVLRSRLTGLPCILDFKTTRSKADRIGDIHLQSLQSIMNSHAVSAKYGQPCGEVQIHVIQLGTEQWPTLVTHAYYRAGQPPYVPEDWQPKPRRKDGTWLGKLYRKVVVHEHRPTHEWIWSVDAAVLPDVVPISRTEYDPKVLGLKITQAICSVILNEQEWRAKVEALGDLGNIKAIDAPTYQALTSQFPRTFSCVQYGRACEYMSLCFDPDMQSAPVASVPVGFTRRQPHHPQEDNL